MNFVPRNLLMKYKPVKILFCLNVRLLSFHPFLNTSLLNNSTKGKNRIECKRQET